MTESLYGVSYKFYTTFDAKIININQIKIKKVRAIRENYKI